MTPLLDRDMLAEQLLEAWRINNRINLFLIDRISAEGMRCTLSQRGGRNVARQFAHLHNVRLMLSSHIGRPYDPVTGEWILTAASTVPRLYHSTALLLPDGRVVASGGNPEATALVEWDKDPVHEEMRLEIFSPPYLFRGPRPTIAGAPEEWQYAQAISIDSPDAGSLRWANLVRNCVTTHSFDGSQRLVDLHIVSQTGGVVTVNVPGNSNIAPPGWYMLFLVNNKGVPSVARWIHLS